MSMVCPQCNAMFEAGLKICPQCHIQLLHHNRSDLNDPVLNDEPVSPPSPLARLIVCLLLSLGMSLALHQFINAMFLSQDADLGFWQSYVGFLTLHALQAFCLIVAGIIAGAGLESAVLQGAVLGLVHGSVFLFLQNQSRAHLSPVLFFCQPFLHMIFGTVGGFIGKMIWRPVPRVSLAENDAPTVPIPTISMRWLRAKIHPFRVLIGTVVVVAGVAGSAHLFDYVVRKSNMTVGGGGWDWSVKYFHLEVAGLAALIGAILAGANTRSGLKQGLCVGVLSASIVIGLKMADEKATPGATLLLVGGVLLLCFFGGGFGSRLFPPLFKGPRRRREY